MDDLPSAHSGEPLGRAAEQAVVERFLHDVAEGDAPRALVVSGQAGIGKTTVWRAALAEASRRGLTILRAGAAETEVSLAYVGLGDLLRDVEPALVDALPAPQRRAIRVATLQEPSGSTALDPRTVGAGLLTLVHRVADAGPLLIAVDDAQWLDEESAGALAFALRRLERGRIGLLLTMRTEDEAGTMPLALDRVGHPWQVEQLSLSPLTVAGLYQLLRTRLGHPFPRPTLLRIAEWSGGNPLFALEIGRSILAAGGALEPSAQAPVPRSLGEALVERLRTLSRDERRTLLLAACAVRPRRDLLDRAARRLGWPVRLPSDRTLLDARDGWLVFGHPLYAAQSVGIATDDDRRRAHRALAEVAEAPEEQARHLALAAPGPDPAVAGALEAAAAGASQRGAPEAAIELEELAVHLTPPEDLAARRRRQRELGELLYRAGDTLRAREVLAAAAEEDPRDPERALVRATLAEALAQDVGAAVGVGICRLALEDAGDDRATRARVELAWCRIATSAAEQRDHAEAALALLEDGPVELRAQALAQLVRAISSLGLPVPGDLLDEAVRLESVAPAPRVLDGPTAVRAWLHLMDDRLDLAHGEYEELRGRAEQLGDESSLARILVELAQIDLRAGRWDELVGHADEAVRIGDRTGRGHDHAMAVIQLGALAAARGDRPLAERHLEEASGFASRAEAPFVRSIVAGNLGVLALGEGDPRAAAELFEAADRELGAVHMADTALGRFHADRLEALVELGEVARAAELADAMDLAARRNGRLRPRAFVDRGRGVIAAARGDLDAAVAALDRSFATLDELGMRFEAARSLLARGIVRRRRREKRLAHEDLSAALETFEALRATVWAERARRELGRIGLRPAAPQGLTDTELTVARLAAEGRTNREIAAAAFLSPRTVEGVLSRVYGKLGIASRAELGRAFAEDGGRTPS